jgi:hypothetical protein
VGVSDGLGLGAGDSVGASVIAAVGLWLGARDSVGLMVGVSTGDLVTPRSSSGVTRSPSCATAVGTNASKNRGMHNLDKIIILLLL